MELLIGYNKQKKMYLNSQPISTILFFNLLISYVYSNTFFHVGIVVKYLGVPYILELSEENIYCNFDKKIANHLPSLSSMDDIMSYKGVICRFPYIGPPVSNDIVVDILSSKNQYVHAWHPSYGLMRNFDSYIYSRPGEFGTCGPPIDHITVSSCPKYINCIQFVCIMLNKMNIRKKNICYKFMPDDLFEFCSNSDLYTNCSIIETPYILEYKN